MSPALAPPGSAGECGSKVGLPRNFAVDLSGQAWLGTNRSDRLGAWFTGKPVVTQKDFEFPATFVLPLTDEQLAVIEQRRGAVAERLPGLEQGQPSVTAIASTSIT